MSDEELQAMAEDCYEILDSDEEGAKKVVEIVERAGGGKGKAKSSKAKKVDPEKKKEVSKANNDLAKNVKKIQKLMNDGLKSASKAWRSARCTEALKKEYSAPSKCREIATSFWPSFRTTTRSQRDDLCP